ncbi:MAG: hypothetical protein J6R90_02400 [Alistipes sp.]|nr:hypothetical protein [Alistipes sp.]
MRLNTNSTNTRTGNYLDTRAGHPEHSEEYPNMHQPPYNPIDTSLRSV